MAHIAFFAPGARGHLNPTLPIVTELAARGHRVSYATDAAAAAPVRAAGAEVVGYRPPPAAPIVINGPEAAARSTLALLAEVEQALPAIDAAYADDRPDLVVTDWLGWAGTMAAARWGTPRVQSWSTFPAGGAAAFAAFNRAMLAAAPAVAAEFDTLLAALLRRHRVPPLTLDDFYAPAPCNLVHQPRSFLHPDLDDDRFVFTGPTRRPEPDAWTPPGRPLVLVALGTIIEDRAFFDTCVHAFAGAPHRTVLAVGDRIDPRDLGPLPPGMEAHRHVPQPAVLAHADVFVTHAGMNSAMESLAAAVPMVAVPRTLEQRTIADRIAALGLGTALAPEAADAETLRAAVCDLLADPSTARRVRALRDEINESGGASRAADTIESRLPAGT